MSKRKDYTKGNVIGFLCFIALVVSAVCFLLTNVAAFSAITGVLSFIASISLLVAVVWSGWGYARTLNQTWRIIYIIVSVIAAIATLFGSGILK